MRNIRNNSAQRQWRLALVAIGIAASSLWLPSTRAQSAVAVSQPLMLEHFSKEEPQAFGDVHNSMARASIWWDGHLYVGTSRDFACAQQAIIKLYQPFKPYPPPDTLIPCASKPEDLLMQAEIWRWTPDVADPLAPGTWDRVYQSQNTIPITGTNKFTAREIGFRDMEVFTEADGTQALYVTGISARSYLGVTIDPVTQLLIPTLPPPTLLRSTDGVNWAPVPQDPGTTFGDLFIDYDARITISSLNRIVAFSDKLYLVVGGDFGHGVLYEATHPEQGNDAWRKVSPGGMTFTYAEVFNNRLYLGQGSQPVKTNPPYNVVKMDTTTDPYTFPVVVNGTRLPASRTKTGPKSVATMHVVGDALWVATNQPVELLRINPNDTWDLYIGNSRKLADGTTKTPRSGLGDSFDWFFNVHIHRMQNHDGFLYTASNDVSNNYPLNTVAAFQNLFQSRYGLDLHRTKNGWHFYPITFAGFQEKDPTGTNNWYNFTGRVANSTPYGLFIGTGNNQYGTQIWRASAGVPVLPPAMMLEAERTGGKVVLSWLPTPVAGTTYKIFKADYKFGFQLGVPFYAGGTTYPNPFVEIGTSNACTPTGCTYVDATPLGLWSHYYVVAEHAAMGATANPSNVTRAPSLDPVTTFGRLKKTINEWTSHNEVDPGLQATAIATLNAAKSQSLGNNFAGAITTLQTLYVGVGAAGPALAPWRVDDAQMLLLKMMRRLTLAQLGLIPTWTVKY